MNYAFGFSDKNYALKYEFDHDIFYTARATAMGLG